MGETDQMAQQRPVRLWQIVAQLVLGVGFVIVGIAQLLIGSGWIALVIVILGVLEVGLYDLGLVRYVRGRKVAPEV
jgi:hypothetical protein